MVGVVFGGISMASAAPAGKPTPTPPPTPIGSPVYMETRTASVTQAQNTQGYIYNEGYAKMSHVSITLQTAGMANGAVLQVLIGVGGWQVYAPNITADGLYVLQYDTNFLKFYAHAYSTPFTVNYNITITHES